jgi:hypothetical protein
MWQAFAYFIVGPPSCLALMWAVGLIAYPADRLPLTVAIVAGGSIVVNGACFFALSRIVEEVETDSWLYWPRAMILSVVPGFVTAFSLQMLPSAGFYSLNKTLILGLLLAAANLLGAFDGSYLSEGESEQEYGEPDIPLDENPAGTNFAGPWQQGFSRTSAHLRHEYPSVQVSTPQRGRTGNFVEDPRPGLLRQLDLARSQFESRQYEQALQAYLQCASLANSYQDIQSWANIGAGNCYSRLSQHSNACNSFANAIEQAEIPDALLLQLFDYCCVFLASENLGASHIRLLRLLISSNQASRLDGARLLFGASVLGMAIWRQSTAEAAYSALDYGLKASGNPYKVAQSDELFEQIEDALDMLISFAQDCSQNREFVLASVANQVAYKLEQYIIGGFGNV